MRVLLDTNIIIRAAQPNQPTWPEINQALTALVAHGCTLCVVPQNIYEFWVVATRPLAQNGFGLTPSDAKSLVDGTLGKLTLLRDERGIFDLWVALVDQYAVEGKGPVRSLLGADAPTQVPSQSGFAPDATHACHVKSSSEQHSCLLRPARPGDSCLPLPDQSYKQF